MYLLLSVQVSTYIRSCAGQQLVHTAFREPFLHTLLKLNRHGCLNGPSKREEEINHRVILLSANLSCIQHLQHTSTGKQIKCLESKSRYILVLTQISSRKSEISWSPFAQALNLRQQEQGQEAGEWRAHQAVPEPPLATALIVEKEAGQKMTLCRSSSPGSK